MAELAAGVVVLGDGALLVTDTPSDYDLTGGTSAGTVIVGHNRFLRGVNHAHLNTVRLIGTNEADDVVVGGETPDAMVLLGADTALVDHARLYSRAPDGTLRRILDVDEGGNLNVGRDDTIGDVQLFGRVIVYDDASSPQPALILMPDGRIYWPGGANLQVVDGRLWFTGGNGTRTLIGPA